MPTASRSVGHRQSMLPELSIENYEKWLEWQAWRTFGDWSRRSGPPLRYHLSGWRLQKAGHSLCPLHQSASEVQVPTGWIAMPGREDEALPDDTSICKGTTVLGGESQSAGVWLTLPFGQVCKGAEAASGKAHHL